MAKGDFQAEQANVEFFGLFEIAHFECDVAQAFSRHDTHPFIGIGSYSAALAVESNDSRPRAGFYIGRQGW